MWLNESESKYTWMQIFDKLKHGVWMTYYLSARIAFLVLKTELKRYLGMLLYSVVSCI